MRQQRGFTLLEVILAMALFGVVTVVVFAAYGLAGGSFTQAERLSVAAGRVRVAYRTLVNDLAAAYYSPYDDRLRFDGRYDRLAFTVRGGARGLRQVWLAPSLHGAELERVEVARVPVRLDSFIRPEGEGEVLLSSRVTFRYLDGRTGSWTSAWRSDVEAGLPAAVEISVENSGEKQGPALPPLTVPIGAGRVYGAGDR